MSNTFIQIHTLTGYSSVLLNRDDSGMAKRIDFGSATRTRTSSQFAKRKLRTATGKNSLLDLGEVSVRSRSLFSKKVAEPLIAEGLDEKKVYSVVLFIMDAMYKPSDKATAARVKAKKEGSFSPLKVLERDELLVLSQRELDFIKSAARSVIEQLDPEFDVDAKDAAQQINTIAGTVFKEIDFVKTLRKMNNTSLDIAAFGRMVTGDAISSIDAAVHVAHAFTVHRQETEVDFFTAVDDLKNRAEGDDAGGGHIGEVEINSPLLYGYYVIDFELLVSNLAGLDNPREVAAEMVSRIVKLTATSIVGAKKGSTAPYSSADFILVEVGDDAPRSLAEAFRKPVSSSVDAAVGALTSYLKAKEKMYGMGSDHRYLMSVVDADIPGAKQIALPALSGELKPLLAAE